MSIIDSHQQLLEFIAKYRLSNKVAGLLGQRLSVQQFSLISCIREYRALIELALNKKKAEQDIFIGIRQRHQAFPTQQSE
jgi:hypothetical protein